MFYTYLPICLFLNIYYINIFDFCFGSRWFSKPAIKRQMPVYECISLLTVLEIPITIEQWQCCITFLWSNRSSSFYLYTYDLFPRSLFSVHITVIGSSGASSQFCLMSIVNYASVWLILTRAANPRMPAIIFLFLFPRRFRRETISFIWECSILFRLAGLKYTV